MEERHAVRIAKTLERIAVAGEKMVIVGERIAVALEAANRNDPIAMIAKAVEAEAAQPRKGKHCRNCDALLDLDQQFCPYCEFDNSSTFVAKQPKRTDLPPPDWMLS